MHDAYEIRTKDDEKNLKFENENVGEAKTTVDTSKWEGGHLRDRLARFDLRTDEMMDKWYMLFAEVRRGSFINVNEGLSKESKEWNQHRKSLREKGTGGGWESLSASSVQFLHWLGFDERNSLALPKGDVIKALAFLGYDFVGKVVEKVRYEKD